MRAVCAWCGIELRPSTATDDVSHDITHGICPTCTEHFFSPRDHSLQGFLNSLDAPVTVVDDDMRMLEANTAALTVLGKTREDAVGLRSGEIIECANSRLPKGCGRQVHCVACTLRNSVRETYETGQGFSGRPAWIRVHDETTDESRKRLRVTISTEKVGNVVLLRLDEVGRAIEGPRAR